MKRWIFSLWTYQFQDWNHHSSDLVTIRHVLRKNNFFLFFFCSPKLKWKSIANLARKRKIYDTRTTNKNSYTSHSYSNHHHHHNHDYTTSSTHRRGNRYGGFTFRGFFEPTPFYKMFGIIIKWKTSLRGESALHT